MKALLSKLKKYSCAFFALMLALIALFLSSCTDEPQIKEGLQVLPSEVGEYSEDTEARATEVFLKLFTLHYEKDVGSKPDETAKAALAARAGKIVSDTRDPSVSEAEYIRFLDALDAVLHSLASELDLIVDGSLEGLEGLGEVYLSLSRSLNSAYAGRIFYHLALYVYDYKYDKQMSLYSQYGYPHLKVKAESLLSEREIFVSKVGEENCVGAVQLFWLVSDLFFGGAFEDGALAGFSDEELLLVLQHVDLSLISMDSEGWELLLSYGAKAISFKELGYYPALFKYAVASGDGKALGAVMNDAVALFNSVNEKLTAKDVAALRSADRKEFLHSVFTRFDEADWQRFERVMGAELDLSLYNSYATEKFGTDYTEYATGAASITLDGLRLAVGTDEFYTAFVKYLTGISPAFSYGVKK